MGFPSPAADFIEPPLDLNEIIDNPISTFYARIGHDPIVSGMHRGDILVIDRALPRVSGSIVLASLSDQFILRRLRRTRDLYVLVADKPYQPSVEVHPDAIWGVVAYVIHKVVPKQRKRPVQSDDADGPDGDVKYNQRDLY